MNLCSVIVQARPEKMNQVETSLARLPGVEVHGGTEEEGKLIVTVEDAEDVSAADTMMSFNDIDGVISAILVYHYGGDDLNEEVIREVN